MYEELREKAVKELEEKRIRRKEIQVVGFVFITVAVILLVVSSRFEGSASFWIKFPIIVLALVFGIIYTSEYGLPFIENDDDISDEEIEREMVKIYRKSNLNELNRKESSETLELQELEKLKEKYETDNDFV